MQITEALLSEPGDIWRFVQQAVDHWPRLLAVHFTRHSTRVNIDDYYVFYQAFYLRINPLAIQRNHTGSYYHMW
ncbi:hypothetical protein ABKF45_001540 [Escherichia coli]|nr:hypothetical protein [Escherichia coli]EEY1570456.1 hypothetical protein [Escherichia coli O21]EFG3959729.1 hypothetical protein [Escherichia coli]MBA8377844.1 hypothetical protein [Escherichia coli]MBA8382939.1 hypothetical protein [Escherichia coli]MBS9624570.1 hypothetical protein [Escherichia coli]